MTGAEVQRERHHLVPRHTSIGEQGVRTLTNQDRAAWAEEALDTYRAMRGKDEPITDVKDLIQDLLHYARLDLGLHPKDCELMAQHAFSSMEEEAKEDDA